MTMVLRAYVAAAHANGQTALTTLKDKNVIGFKDQAAFMDYVERLIATRDKLCNITSMPLHFHGDDDIDNAMLCSLDRIDSDDHYAPGNLQVICQFVNKWKGASNDDEFRRLVGEVRSVVSI